ncbi:MAG TPA: PilW family protein [Burkholderiaceae bacterium]|jgi:type IV pilus assembly protein PilW
MRKQNDCKLIKAQIGLTIVELMISMVLGLIVILAGTTLLLASKSSYATLDDSAQLQDTGRYAMDAIARAVHQTSYANWDKEDAPILTGATNTPDITGLDSQSLNSAMPDIQSPIQKSINASDILAVRYFGAGTGENGDGTVLNCAGFSVPAVQSIDSAEEGRAWSIFYVAKDSSGEPELRCKYHGKNSWTSEAIARGVESFQVLYGIDTDADGLPNQFISASAVDELDANVILTGPNATAREIELRKKTYWKKVVAIKVALLIRGSKKSRSDALSNKYELFGSEYSTANAADNGAVLKEENIPVRERNRLRKIFQNTIMLHSQFAGDKT